MPTYRHPRAADDAPGHPPARVHVSRAEKAPVREDGTFEAPAGVAAAIAAQHGVSVEAMRADRDDGGEDSTGNEGADLNQQDGADDPVALVNDGICPWCSDEDDRYEGDHLGQHASSAHPQAWAAYKEGSA